LWVNGSVRKGWIFLVFLLFFITFTAPVTAYTTELTVTKLAADGLTVIDKQTVSYQWMRDNLPVLGDGTTHYYLQGPVFVDDLTNETHEQELRWNQDEDTNCYPDKDFGAVRGTNIAALCDLVGGMSPGEEVKVQSSDGWNRKFAYTNIYAPPARTGPMIIAWEKDGLYPSDTGYFDGMRLVWLADTSVNPFGEHVFGNYDWHESAAPQYWYYYTSGTENYPTTTGLSAQIVSDLIIYSNDPVPPPTADFTAGVKTGRIVNGNFETALLAPWSGSVATATIYTGTSTVYKHGTASVRLAAPAGGSAWISQSADLTGVSTINFYRDMFGGSGKYLQVYVDSTLVANYTEVTSPLIATQGIDLSSYGFSGTHTVKFNTVNTLTSGAFTVYLDDIEDFGTGTSGPAPLTIGFKDLSSRMEDPTHTSWAWDFQNDGSTDSTSQNPAFTYLSDGVYTVKLTATNAGGSDPEIKTGYITVGTVTPPPVANFIASPLTGAQPLLVQFNDTSTNSPTSWKWAYRNATTGWTQFSAIRNATITFGTGTYDINLTAINAAGSDDEIKVGYITVTQPPTVANFTAVPRMGTAPLSVQFNDTSNNTPISWRWAYKNATTGWTQFSTVRNLTYSFPLGTYDINLTATNAAGSDDEVKVGYIIVTQPPTVANFTAVPRTGAAPLSVQFNDTSNNTPISWRWAYKNATTGWTQFSVVRNATFSFGAGTYDINLTATNAGGSDDEIKTGYIVVSTATPAPVANFTATPRTGTAPLTVQFNDTSTNSPVSWKWAYKNATVGWTQFSTVRNVKYSFPAGTYDINLTATNAGGSDDEIKTGYIATSEIPYIDVDVTGSVDNWILLTGSNEDTTSVDMTIATNLNSWSVSMRDALDGGKPAGTAGKMAEWTSGSGYIPSGKSLANALQVKSGTGSYLSVSGTGQTLQTGTAHAISYDLGLRQVITGTDPALEGNNRYHMVITFTGGAT
jgi:PKD repeat protein